MQNLVTNALLNALNRVAASLIALDPDGKRNLAQLRGKVFCLQVHEPPLTLYLLPTEQGLEFRRAAEATPDVTLTGSVFAFARLSQVGLSGNDATNFFADSKVTIQGDAELGQALQKILSQLDLDWEELLSRYVGDRAAHQVGNVLRGLSGWATHSGALARENVADYLIEEKRMLLDKNALAQFENAVHAVRADMDRLTLRAERLTLAMQADADPSR